MSIEGASLSDDGMLSLVSRNKSATSEPLAPVIFTWKPQSQSSLQLENHQPVSCVPVFLNEKRGELLFTLQVKTQKSSIAMKSQHDIDGHDHDGDDEDSVWLRRGTALVCWRS
eukprot:TRINITY_DN2513_c0_g1_i3.p1 TRINITY_DN2513_c0_g1~~TRINITY_DN2513_c0_g1_i3.p1  ORF type:complete len:113 (-),score=25.23 TRINITY_DN2513_c0_g1_i3:64-402(-)